MFEVWIDPTCDSGFAQRASELQATRLASDPRGGRGNPRSRCHLSALPGEKAVCGGFRRGH
jgi:hypothetical protein